MLSKEVKSKDVDKIIKYVNYNGEGKNPIELTEKEMVKLARVNFAYDQRKKGYTRKQVVDMIQKEYDVSIATAYLVVNETELIMGPVGISPKTFAKVLAEEWCLQGIRMAIASRDLANMDKFLGKYMKLHGLFDPETESISPDVLQRNTIYLTGNPEDVGRERIPLDEIKAFYEEKRKKPAPRTIDISPKDEPDAD